ncbi:MAG: CHAT domain-containing protein [Symploca sp. SIO2D2]|nr:CHAT domain-containing protein [Symploca sp. SIO2D2]
MDSKIEADKFLKQGINQYEQNNLKAAIENYQEALEIYQTLKNFQGEANVLGVLGHAYQELKDYDKAIKCYQQSLTINQNIQDKSGQVTILGQLAIACEDLGDYSQAIDFYQERLALSQEIKDRRNEMYTLAALGEAYEVSRSLDLAVKHYEEYLAIAQEIQDDSHYGFALESLGKAYYLLEQNGKSIEYYRQALVVVEKLGYIEWAGEILTQLGAASYDHGDYREAIVYQQRSLAISQNSQDYAKIILSLRYLGNCHEALGDYVKAIDYHEQCLAISRKIKIQKEEASALGNLGNAYRVLANYERSLDYHQSALSIAQKINNRSDEAKAFGNLGNTYVMLGDYAKAVEYHQKNLVIAREIEDRRGQGAALGNLAVAYQQLGDDNKAIECSEENLIIAREIEDIKREATALANLGSAYNHLGNYDRAIIYYNQSLSIRNEIEDIQGQGLALNNLGLTLWQAGRLLEAEETFRAAILVWEKLRAKLDDNDSHKISIFEEQSRTYFGLQIVLVKQQKNNLALEIAERGRARAFVELLATRLFSKSAAKLDIAAPSIAKIKQIAQSQKITLVEYSVVHDSLIFIWVIQASGEIFFHSRNIAGLKQTLDISFSNIVTQFHESLFTGETQEEGSSSWKCFELQILYRILIYPIQELLPTSPDTPVVFIPQDTLFLVPFPALQDEEGTFLIEKHTIFTAPSIQVLELIQNQSKQARETSLEALVVGNPQMPTIPLTQETLNPLEWAEAEANAIAPIFHTQPITGQAATKVNIVEQISKARIIHLATHGLLDDIRQLGVPGAIALAPSNDDSGFLTAGEIYHMKLNAQLVVLSACSTGRGRITGDGVVGLSRCLIAAGVPSIIVSLWSVNDQSTALLMVKFYQILQQGITATIALNQAQLWLLGITKQELLVWVEANQNFFAPALRMNLRRRLHKLEDSAKPFHNPRHWAAFCAIG